MKKIILLLVFFALIISSCQKTENSQIAKTVSDLKIPDGFDWSSSQANNLSVDINGNGNGQLLCLYDLDGNKIDCKTIKDNKVEYSYSLPYDIDTLRLYSPNNFLSKYILADQENAEFSFNAKLKSSGTKSSDYALDFNGESDYVKIDNNGNGGIVTGFPFTFSAWFKTPGPTAGNKKMVLVNIADPNYASRYYGICIRKYGSKYKPVIVARNGGKERVKSFNQNLADETWHQVVGVFVSNRLRKLYVDGIYTGKSSSNVTFNTAAILTSFGRWGDNTPSEYFNKLIDNVCIWNKELSDDEISNYYNNLPNGTEANLVGFWDFNEGSGTIVNNSSSSGGYDGNIIGAQYELTSNPQDSDGDGVADENDDFPNDPDRAYNIVSPSGSNYYFHLFEDLWPNKGDYDFNDVILKTKLYTYKNSNNELVGGKIRSKVYWIGGGIPRGVGMEWLKSNGSGSELAYLPAGTTTFTESANVVPDPDVTNAVKLFDGNIIESLNDTVNFEYTWDHTTGGNSLCVHVYIYSNRGHEVHMYGYPPTTAANMNLFNTGNDASQTTWDWTPGNNFSIPANFYKTITNLPWGLEIITDTFRVPNEKTQIINAYPLFEDWAESGGAVNQNWYKYPDISKTFLPE